MSSTPSSDWDLLQDYEADLEHRIEDARGEQLLSLKDPAWKENGGVVELRPRQAIVPPPRMSMTSSASAMNYGQIPYDLMAALYGRPS